MTGRESRDNDHSLQCESDDPSIMKSLKGHKNKITKVKFLLNKKYLISSSQDGTLMFWTMSNKKRPVRFIGHEDGVLALACAESKNSYGSGENPGVVGRIASAGMDRSIRTWTGTSEGKSVVLKCAHSGAIRSLQYANDDRILLSASDDKLCKLWDVSNSSVAPKFKLSLRGHQNWVREAAMTSDGTIACSVSDDKTWKLWDVCAGGVEIDSRREEKHNRTTISPRCVSMRPPSGTAIAVGDSKGGLSVYDTRSRRKIFESTSDSYVYSHQDAITDVQWHPAGDFIATTSMDGSTKIWDFRDKQCAWTLKAHEGAVNCTSFTSDGAMFACGGCDGIVTVWNSGFNRTLENVSLAEKQTHDDYYDSRTTTKTTTGERHRRRQKQQEREQEHHHNRNTANIKNNNNENDRNKTTTTTKDEPATSSRPRPSSSQQFAQAQTLRRAVGQIDVLTQTLALVEARVTMVEDSIQRVLASIVNR